MAFKFRFTHVDAHLKKFTGWRLGSDLQDELVGGGSFLVGDNELIFVSDVLLLEVVDGQSHGVFAGQILQIKQNMFVCVVG